MSHANENAIWTDQVCDDHSVLLIKKIINCSSAGDLSFEAVLNSPVAAPSRFVEGGVSEFSPEFVGYGTKRA
jgi:hypothetical protein